MVLGCSSRRTLLLGAGPLTGGPSRAAGAGPRAGGGGACPERTNQRTAERAGDPSAPIRERRRGPGTGTRPRRQTTLPPSDAERRSRLPLCRQPITATIRPPVPPAAESNQWDAQLLRPLGQSAAEPIEKGRAEPVSSRPCPAAALGVPCGAFEPRSGRCCRGRPLPPLPSAPPGRPCHDPAARRGAAVSGPSLRHVPTPCSAGGRGQRGGAGVQVAAGAAGGERSRSWAGTEPAWRHGPAAGVTGTVPRSLPAVAAAAGPGRGLRLGTGSWCRCSLAERGRQRPGGSDRELRVSVPLPSPVR